jgi:hypothetical protein
MHMANHRATASAAAAPAPPAAASDRIADLATHPEPNLSPRQLADYWGKDIETIHRWIRKGALRARKVGVGPPASRCWLIRREDAVEFESWSE